jgi:hypothetical protein
LQLNIDMGQLALWAAGLSIVMTLAAAVALPWVVARLPKDYFSRPARETWGVTGNPPEPLLARVLGVLKNAMGAALVMLGVVLLFVPGQGALTILAGLLLMNFPGKYRLERWLVQRSGVFKGLNWLRQRAGSAPFDPMEAPDDPGEAGSGQDDR